MDGGDAHFLLLAKRVSDRFRVLSRWRCTMRASWRANTSVHTHQNVARVGDAGELLRQLEKLRLVSGLAAEYQRALRGERQLGQSVRFHESHDFRCRRLRYFAKGKANAEASAVFT